jgi:hypothetical protein
VVGVNLVEGINETLLIVSGKLGIVPIEDGGRLLEAMLMLSLELSNVVPEGRPSEMTAAGDEIVGVGECGIGGVC